MIYTDSEEKTLPDRVAGFERFLIALSLHKFRGNQRKAARALGITRWTLARKIKKLDLKYLTRETEPRLP